MEHGVDHLKFTDDDNRVAERVSALKQCAEDMVRRSPNRAIRIVLSGGTMRLECHMYEARLNDPQSMRRVSEAADELMDEALRLIKKEYQSKRKEALKIKERKDHRDCRIEKASQNERYYYVSWRNYEVDLQDGVSDSPEGSGGN